MATDIILEEHSARITDGDLDVVDGSINVRNGVIHCKGDTPLQASFRGSENTRVDIKSGEISIRSKTSDGTSTSASLSLRKIGFIEQILSGKVIAETVEANEVRVGTGTANEPREPGVLFLEDGQGDVTIHVDGKFGNVILGGDNADGDLILKDEQGKERIQLTGGRGPIHNSARVVLDGKNGNIKLSGEVINLSDARCKENVESLSGALEKIVALRGVYFRWKKKEGCPEIDGRRIGLIAQEVKEVLPEAVSEDAKGLHSLTYASLVPVLIEALKEQQRTIEAQDVRLSAMEARLEGLEAAILQHQVPAVQR